MKTLSALLVALALAPVASSLADRCPPTGVTKAQLLELKEHEYALDDAKRVQSLALGLTACLGDPDPELRDGIAYEAYATWMREKKVTTDTARQILRRLEPQIASDFPDRQGFIRPFSALILAEVARMDRIDAFLTDAERTSLLQSATLYMKSIGDYRGFDARVGWRHGVAHDADLLMQLALNPKLDKVALDTILDAVATQVTPPVTPDGEHFYIYGEGERLARPVFYVAQRHLHSSEEWAAWFSRLTSPAPMKNWDDAFKSQAGLAKRHNLYGFLTMLYLYVQENGDADTKERIAKSLVGAITALP
jgi:hypothetical protein